MSVLEPPGDDEQRYLKENCTCGEQSLDPHYHRAPCPLALVEEVVVFEDDEIVDAEIVDEDEDILAKLDAKLMDVDYTEIIRQAEADAENVQKLSKPQLLQRFASVERQLREIKELLIPRTDHGRELHSRRSAYMVELKRRGMR